MDTICARKNSLHCSLTPSHTLSFSLLSLTLSHALSLTLSHIHFLSHSLLLSHSLVDPLSLIYSHFNLCFISFLLLLPFSTSFLLSTLQSRQHSCLLRHLSLTIRSKFKISSLLLRGEEEQLFQSKYQ